MHVLLWQGPEGSPNFCFGIYAHGPGRYGGKDYQDEDCVDFVQNDWGWADLAEKLGWTPPEDKSRSDQLSDAFDWLEAHDGQHFEIGDDRSEPRKERNDADHSATTEEQQ